MNLVVAQEPDLRRLIAEEVQKAVTAALASHPAPVAHAPADDDGAELMELLEAGALLGVYDADGRCRGAAVIVDFGSPDGGHCG